MTIVTTMRPFPGPVIGISNLIGPEGLVVIWFAIFAGNLMALRIEFHDHS